MATTDLYDVTLPNGDIAVIADSSARSSITDLNNWTSPDTKTVTGNPISIQDAANLNAEALSVSIEPIQDLHGYDKPWVGGAGKNLLPMTIEKFKAENTAGIWSGNAYTYRGVTFTLLTDSNNNIIGIKASGTASGGNASIRLLKPDLQDNTNYILTGGASSSLNIQYSNMSNYSYDDNGSGITIQKFDYSAYPNSSVNIRVMDGVNVDNTIFYPMIRLSTETDPTFAPYTNICPISGLTSAEVKREGKNLFDGVYPDIVAGRVTYRSIYVGNGTFTISTDCPKNLSSGANIFFLAGNVQSGAATNTNGIWNGQTRTVTTTDGYVTVGYRNDDFDPTDYHTQIESGSTATAYEPYQSTTATIQFGQTVYGGTVDMLSGEVVVTHGYADIGDLTWTYSATNARFSTIDLQSTIEQRALSETSEIMSSAFETNASAIGTTNLIDAIASNANGTIFIRCNEYENASNFVTAMTGQTICYELATPTTLTLTPTELKLLKQYNYLTTNGATISLTYQPDTLLGEAMEYTDGRCVLYPGDAPGQVKSGSDIIPNVNGNLSLGSSGYKWKNVYADNIDLADDTLSAQYKLGVSNGLLYIEEV